MFPERFPTLPPREQGCTLRVEAFLRIFYKNGNVSREYLLRPMIFRGIFPHPSCIPLSFSVSLSVEVVSWSRITVIRFGLLVLTVTQESNWGKGTYRLLVLMLFRVFCFWSYGLLWLSSLKETLVLNSCLKGNIYIASGLLAKLLIWCLRYSWTVVIHSSSMKEHSKDTWSNLVDFYRIDSYLTADVKSNAFLVAHSL